MRVGTPRLGAWRSIREWRTAWGGNGSARLAGREPLHGGIHLERRIGSDVHLLGHGSKPVQMKRDRVTARDHVQPLEHTIKVAGVTGKVSVDVHFGVLRRHLGSDVALGANVVWISVAVGIPRSPEGLVKYGL